MTELATVQNIGNVPVIIDEEGHTLGVGEYGTAAHRTDLVRELIHNGQVGVVTATPGPDSQLDGRFVVADRDRAERADRERAERADRDRADKADRERPADARQARKGANTTAQEG